MPAPTTATRWGTGRPAAVMGAMRRAWQRSGYAALCQQHESATSHLCSEHKHGDAGRVLAVTDLVATLGGLLTLGVPRPGAEVDDLTIAEPGQGIVGQPGDLVLGVGVESAEAAADLVAAGRRGGRGRRGAAPRHRPAPHRPRPRPAQRHRPGRARRAGVVGPPRLAAARGHRPGRRRPGAARRRPGAGRPLRARRRRGRARRRPGDDRGRPVAGAGLLLAPGPRRPRPRLDHRRPPGARRGAGDPARAGRLPPAGALGRAGLRPGLRRHQAPPGHPGARRGRVARLDLGRGRGAPTRRPGRPSWSRPRPSWRCTCCACAPRPTCPAGSPPTGSAASCPATSRAPRTGCPAGRGASSRSAARATRCACSTSGSRCAAGTRGTSRCSPTSTAAGMPWCATPTSPSPGHLGLAGRRWSPRRAASRWTLTARAGRTAYAPAELERSRGEAQETDRVVGPGSRGGRARGGVGRGHRRPGREHAGRRPARAARGAARPRRRAPQRPPADAGRLAGPPGRADRGRARSIHVHPNTMRYRMARIADLAGLDLDDATVRLAPSACQIAASWAVGRQLRVSRPSSCRGSA